MGHGDLALLIDDSGPMTNQKSKIENPKSLRVLGARVDAAQIRDVVELMERWIGARSACHLIAFTGMHGITETQYDPSFKQILNSADLVLADGMPLVWLGHWHGHAMRRRVYGPELMETFCRKTGHLYQHYFYGGGTGALDRLAEILKQWYGVRGVGCRTQSSARSANRCGTTSTARTSSAPSTSFSRTPGVGQVCNIGRRRFSNCSMAEAIGFCEQIVERPLTWKGVDQNRQGDHVWSMSCLSHFQAHCPGWTLHYDVPNLRVY